MNKVSHPYTLERSFNELVLNTTAGQLGYIVRDGSDAYANLPMQDGFARALVAPFKRLRDAVAFVMTEEVAL